MQRRGMNAMPKKLTNPEKRLRFDPIPDASTLRRLEEGATYYLVNFVDADLLVPRVIPLRLLEHKKKVRNAKAVFVFEVLDDLKEKTAVQMGETEVNAVLDFQDMIEQLERCSERRLGKK
jgi:hypothetical protein